MLNFVINAFDADVIDIDYRIRGMTRNTSGQKLFTIDKLNNLSDFLSTELTTKYVISEHNLSKQQLYHSKLRRKRVYLDDHLFGARNKSLSKNEQCLINASIEQEIEQLFTNTY